MAKLSTAPQTVDVDAYAGDTLTIQVTAPDALVAGREWSAQVRSAADSALVDAEFTITPPSVADGPAYLILPSDVTAALVTGGTLTTMLASGRTIVEGKYVGVWDVQLAPAGGGDPVTTLARGTLIITGDVTRVEP